MKTKDMFINGLFYGMLALMLVLVMRNTDNNINKAEMEDRLQTCIGMLIDKGVTRDEASKPCHVAQHGLPDND